MEGANKSNGFRGLAVADQNDLLKEVTDRTASVDRPEKKFGNGLVPLFREIENSERPSAMLMKTLADRPYMLEFVDKKFHSSLLHHAAAQGKLAIVKYLLWKYEANLNSVDKRGCTPLDCAQGASAGNVVDFLRSKGAKTRTELLEPTTTVMHDVENQPVKMEKAEIDSSINCDNGKALVSDLLKTLLKKSLTESSVPRGDLISFVHRCPNLINTGLFELDKTMLHLAARAGKLEVVKWLIGKGAKIDVLDSRGSSPILIASSAGAVEVVDYLRAKEKSAETTQSSLAQDTLRDDDLSKVEASPVALISTEMPSLSDRIGIDKRFIDNGDSTATDALTGLMWMRFCEGQNGFGSHPVSEATAMSRDIALSLTPEFAGYLDWRLPSVDELKTLVIKGQGSPCIDSEVFPKTPSKVFWSASSSTLSDSASV